MFHLLCQYSVHLGKDLMASILTPCCMNYLVCFCWICASSAIAFMIVFCISDVDLVLCILWLPQYVEILKYLLTLPSQYIVVKVLSVLILFVAQVLFTNSSDLFSFGQ